MPLVLAREFKGLSFINNVGSILIYDCSVIGEGSTVWTGGGFNCPSTNNRIILKNTAEYITTFGVCNSGSIIGRGISVAGDHFTSELNINYTPDLKGKNVTCIYDNGSVEVIIGTAPIVYVPERTNPGMLLEGIMTIKLKPMKYILVGYYNIGITSINFRLSSRCQFRKLGHSSIKREQRESFCSKWPV